MLSPYRVLDLTDERGHLAGFMLAMLGAEVIAVEPPEGSHARRIGPFVGNVTALERSLTHFAYNRGKKSVVLDLQSEVGRQHLRQLVAGADVLIESGDPGELAALGFGPEDLATVNPALVYASISAFGRTGPKAEWLATDLTVMASAATLAITGDADRPPVRVTVPQAFHFGAAAAAGAIIIALLERARSGLGQYLDASAQTVVPLGTQAGVLAAGSNFPVARRSAGGMKVGPLELRFVYPAKDGWVSITHVFGNVIGPRTADLMTWACEEGFCDERLRDLDWVNFAEHVDRGLASVEDFEAAKAAIAAFCSSHTKAELLEGAIQRRLLLAPIATPDDVVTSEQLAFRQFFDFPEHAIAGPIAAPGRFVRCDQVPLRRLGAAPTLGADTAKVLGQPPRLPASTASSTSGVPGGPGTALAGLKVVDLSWSIAGPVTSRVLADHGATVLKIESLTKPDAARGFMPIHDNVPGLERSALFDDMNAGKLSVSLNLSKPEGRAVFLDLVRWADVVVESYSPRAMPAWGLAYPQLCEINPALIMLSTCLCGQDGPMANFAGYGNLGAALAGFYGLAGWPDRPPAGPFGAYTDYTSNHFLLVSLLGALDHRRRTGEGCYLDGAQSEAAIHFLSPALLDWSVNGHVMERAGNRDPQMAPHGIYRCAGDDQWVAVACQSDPAWPALAATIGRADLAAEESLSTSAARRSRHDELDEAVLRWSSQLSPSEAEKVLQAAGVAAHAVQSSEACIADPQLGYRRHFLDLEHPERRCLVENARVELSRTPAVVALRAPFLGEHTVEVLTDVLGYDGDRIGDLFAAEVLE